MPELLLLYQHPAKAEALLQHLQAVEPTMAKKTLIPCWMVSEVLDLSIQGQLGLNQGLKPLYQRFDPIGILAAEMQALELNWRPPLLCIEAACQQPRSLSSVQTQLQPLTQPQLQPFWLALYILLSTPDDYRLALARTQAVSQDRALTAALVGAWLGGKIGKPGLPLVWQLFDFTDQEADEKDERLIALIEIQQLAERLFAQWSGIDPAYIDRSDRLLPAIAIP